MNRAMRSILPIYIVIVAIISAAWAQAVDMPTVGAYDQGASFRLQCPTGEYMVGAEGRRGAWIDSIAPRCAPWDRSAQQFGVARPLPAVGGLGGEQALAFCPNAPLIKSMFVTTTRTSPAYIDMLIFHCRDKAKTIHEAAYFNGKGEDSDGRGNFQYCPDDYVAVGLHGRAGDYLDAIGLICAPLPPDRSDLVPPRAIRSLSKTRPQTGLPDSLERSASSTSSGSGQTTPPAVDDRQTPVAPAAPQMRFESPSIRSDDGAEERLDYCLNFSDQCGAPAASAYCAMMTPQTPVAIDAPLEFGVGRTFTIGDRQLCEQENCSSFSYVICGS